MFLRPRKPFWNKELSNLWSQINTAKKLLRREINNGDKNLRHSELKAKQHIFDHRFRFYKRQYRYQSCIKTLKSLKHPTPNNSGKNLAHSKPKIPFEVYGAEDIIIPDKECVLRKWKNDFKSLYNDSDNVTADQFPHIKKTNDIVSMECY